MVVKPVCEQANGLSSPSSPASVAVDEEHGSRVGCCYAIVLEKVEREVKDSGFVGIEDDLGVCACRADIE